MNATKRKFNTLLQGLGAQRPTTPDNSVRDTSNSPLSSSTGNRALASESLLQKRRRLGQTASTSPLSTGQASMKRLPSGQLVQHPSSSATPAAQGGLLSKYCPSDRDQLLRRLVTFQELTDWTPKPERVSEVEWAKRGWVCQGKERVRCVLCHRELVVKVNRKEQDGQEIPVLVSSEIEGALVDKYAELIITSHQDDCLWRKRGCEDSLLRLSLASSKATIDALRERYNELCSRTTFLPYEFNIRLPEGVCLDDVLLLLPPDFFAGLPPIDDPTKSLPNRSALTLALFGWQGLSNPRIGAVPNSASCHTCLRRLGLWMFKSKEVDAEGNILVSAPMDHLDPVREHRSFCPWKNPQAQSREPVSSAPDVGKAGWELLLQTLRNEAHLRRLYEGRSQPSSGAHLNTRVPGNIHADGHDSHLNEGTKGVDEKKEGDAEDRDRDAKDKERWARLRKVKSLFDTKGGKRSSRPTSRPGTSHSTVSGTGK